MAIPDFQTVMLPLLKFSADGKEHTLNEAAEVLAKQMNLTLEENAARLPSGKQLVFHNRIGWARWHLKTACLLSAPRRGIFHITERGLQVLAEKPSRIDLKFLDQFPEHDMRALARKDSHEEKIESPALETQQTPEEALEFAHQSMRQALAQELLSRNLAAHQYSLKNWSLSCWCLWDTAALAAMQASALGKVVMVELTASLKKIASALILFIFKPSVGKAMLVVQKFKNLLAHYKVNELEKAYLLPPHHLQQMQSIMHHVLILKWC